MRARGRDILISKNLERFVFVSLSVVSSSGVPCTLLPLHHSLPIHLPLSHSTACCSPRLLSSPLFCHTQCQHE